MKNYMVIYDSDWRLDDDGFQDWLTESDDYVKECSEYEQQQMYAEYIYGLLDDERANLNIPISGTVLAYGGSQGWNRTSYGADPGTSNVNSIFDLFSGDPERYYIENGDVCGYFGGHDGPTCVIFREASPEYIAQLDEGEPIGGEDAFKANTTSLAPYVCRVYGW